MRDAGHRTPDGAKSKNNISTPQGGGHNSNMTLTVLNLHQKTEPKVQQDFNGQGHYDKVKLRSHHDNAHL